MLKPERIELIGTEIAIAWADGSEDYFPCDYLRLNSPSADNQGEKDLLGHTYGGTDQTDFSGVTVKGWQIIGGYAIQFEFSDSHNTGLFSFKYLKELSEKLPK